MDILGNNKQVLLQQKKQLANTKAYMTLEVGDRISEAQNESILNTINDQINADENKVVQDSS